MVNSVILTLLISTVTAMGWMSKESQFDCWQGQGIFLSSKVSRLSLGPIEPPIQSVERILY
jgi:hypothetical protein